jgi:hypothetical protein
MAGHSRGHKNTGHKNTIVATRIARLAISVETLRKERVPVIIRRLINGSRDRVELHAEAIVCQSGDVRADPKIVSLVIVAQYLRRGIGIRVLSPGSDRARPDVVTTIRPTTQVAPIALTAARPDSA